MPNQPPPFGSPRLDQVIDTWSSSSVLNPRLLASELAALLRTAGPEAQPLGSHAVTVTLFDTATGSGTLTIGTLATYFERYSAGEQPGTVETTIGSARASAVYFDKSWIGRLEIETEARARTAASLQQMHPAARPTGGAQPSAQYQPPKSGSDPECLALHQAQQRQEGERSDAAKLEAFEQRALLAERENAKLLAWKQTAEYHHQQTQEENEQLRRRAEEATRARTLAVEKLREHAGVIEFMNPDNPLAPLEGQRLVTAWCDLTNNGTEDVITTKGTGMAELCARWLTERFGKPAESTIKRFCWALTSPSRKKGGAIANGHAEKG